MSCGACSSCSCSSQTHTHGLSAREMSQLLSVLEPWNAKVSVEEKHEFTQLDIRFLEAVEDVTDVVRAVQNLGHQVAVISSDAHRLMVRLT